MSLATCLMFLPGCTYIRMAQELGRIASRGPALSVDGYEVAAPRPLDRFSAGVATEDITPPPGFPTGGHGPEGGLPRGHWMRLRARAFFFEDRAGRTLALVSCDLFALPGGLHAKVAERIAAKAAEQKLAVSLPPESLILAATHTHHSPGNYMTARVYNQFGSAYSGFSKPLFEFLAERIADAVLGALHDARRQPGQVELAVHVQQVDYALVRNRSPDVFMLNRERDTLLATLSSGAEAPDCAPRPGEPSDGWYAPECPRLRATDRALTVVDIRRVNGERRDRVGALVFFAVHPTVLAARTPLYNPDFVGYAMQSLERDWATAEGQPVVGFFNGAEGDITTRRTSRDLLATREFGTRFARNVRDALSTTPVLLEREPTLTLRALRTRPGEEDERMCTDERGRWSLSGYPMFGAAAFGGAEGDHTVLDQVGWSAGAVDRAMNGQGMKLPALDSRLVRPLRFTEAFAPPESFPDSIPLTLVSLGGLTLATLPGEVSTAQGLALREALGGAPHGKLELIGLANEYTSYCASRDEYNAQDYVGASTIWGPEQGPFLACSLRGLATSEVRPVARKIERRKFWPGYEQDPAFGPAFTGDDISRPDDGLHQVLRDARGVPVRGLPWFAWSGPLGMCAKALCPADARRVAIWERTPEGWRELVIPGEGREDDLGAGFLTVLMARQGRWATLWLRPLFQPERQGTFAFVAYPPGKPPRCSRPFALGAGLPAPDEVGQGTCDARGAPAD
ncbi:neutral/alkaline non-lysosomal ceramidase N-terminal domain-containing protein [Archangium gephyra]|uniref:neutral/alkaline non-lysosomal ceramidase N-terminal domain-containing protein n=1 Tax=Archangium gephyra TaxID=48 RepID=UPI0035D49209